jgi:hypothetical protein
LLIASGILATGGYAYWRWDSRRKRLEGLQHRKTLKKNRTQSEKAKEAADVACLKEYLQPGAALADQVRASLTYASIFVDHDATIGLNARTQTRVFAVAARQANAGETGNIDRAVKFILREVMPDCAWDTIAWPPEAGSDWATAYAGVEELLQLAALEMRHEDYHSITINGVEQGVGLICPGWNNLAPAATANLAVGDMIEVMLGVEDLDGEASFTEMAFARVTRIEGDTIAATLVGPDTEVDLGTSAPLITGSHQHGYEIGDGISLHRRCVYSMRKKAS